MKRILMTMALLVAATVASADNGWHRGWERKELRHERHQVQCERERVERERARIEHERMRIEMERERIRQEERMRREREARHHDRHRDRHCDRKVVVIRERPYRDEPAPPPPPPSRPTARIEVVWQSGPLVMK